MNELPSIEPGPVTTPAPARRPRAFAPRRPRVLVVTPRFPYPVVGGDRLRIWNVCRALAQDCDLTLLSLCERKEELALPVPEDGVFEHVERILHSPWHARANAGLALLTHSPLQVAYYASAALRRRARELAPAHDLLVAHLVRTAPAVLGLGRPVMVEMTDAISMNYERIRRHGARAGGFKAAIFALEASRVAGYEREVLRAADLAVFVSEVDRRFVLAGGGVDRDNTLVVGNGVESSRFPFAFAECGARVALIGNMTTVQNLDAAHHFAAAVLPLVRRAVPEARFEVVGRIRPRDRGALERFDGVTVTGEVPDVAAVVRGAAVGVCPVRLGAGVQNKILEYMALGLPVVASSVGAEGLAARPGKELLVADAPGEVATAVVELIRDRMRARALAEAARRHVVDDLSWPVVMAPLRRSVAELIAQTASAAPSP